MRRASTQSVWIASCLIAAATAVALRPAGALDCNLNGVDDATDIGGGASLDCQGDGVPDECDVFPLRFDTTPVGVGAIPGAVIVGDLGGPNRADLAVSTLNDDTVEIFYGQADGSFAFARSVAVGARPEALLSQRLSSGIIIVEGGEPIITANAVDGTVSVLEPNLGGTYFDITGSPFAVGGAPNGLAAGDLDGDTRVDLLVTDRALGQLVVLLNDGAGSFTVGAGFPTGANPRAVVTGDVDDDGDVDAVVGARDTGEVVLLENDAGTSFLPAVAVHTVTDPIGLDIADVDADGDLDLAVLSIDLEEVRVLRNDGAGAFSLLTTVPVGAQPFDVRLEDVDGNGTPDLIVPAAADDALTLALNRGDGLFDAPANVRTGDGPLAVVARDFDRDGRTELASADVLSQTFTVLRPQGEDADCDGSGVPDACELADDDCDESGVLDTCEKAGGRGFDAPVASPASDRASAVAAGDFDEDGFEDALALAGDSVLFFRGQADGTMLETASFGVGNDPDALVVLDLDGDTHLDVATANSGDDTVSILRGSGTGTVLASSVHAAGTNPSFLVADDLDRDGDVDLAVASESTTNVTVLTQDAGAFSTGPITGLVGDARGLGVGDADGDRHPDLLALVAVGGSDSALQVVRNAGGGTLTPQAPTVLARLPDALLGLGAGDLDGDEVVDATLLLLGLQTGVLRLAVALGDGAGGYALGQTLPVAEVGTGFLGLALRVFPWQPRIGDADADGDPDVLLPFASNVRVFANDGTGKLGLGESVPTGSFSNAFALGDVGGDGAADLILPTPGLASPGELATLRSLALPAEAVCFGGCLTVPAASCVEMGRARLKLSEKRAGREKLKLTLKSPLDTVPVDFLGDPVSGATRVDVCVYDEAETLVGELGVDRAGDVCGPRASPCWKALGNTGFAYKDPDAASSGVRKIKAKSKQPEKTQLSVQARNKTSKGQNDLPLGLAAALESAARTRVQVLTTDGACFDAALPTVKKADGVQFDAKAP